MDAVALTWLSIGFGLLGVLVGVVATNRYAKQLALRSGGLDKPELSLSLMYLPAVREWTITIVLPEQPAAKVVWSLVGIVHNTGKRAAQQVLVQLVVPKAVIDERATYEVSYPGLVPGLESKHEVLGPFAYTMASWPYIAPGEKVGLAQECALESTSLDLVFNDVQTADGRHHQIAAQAVIAWTATLQVRDLDTGWAHTSVKVKVAFGSSVEEVAKAQRKEIEDSLLKESGLDTATGPRRLLARFKRRRLARVAPTRYFVTPRLTPANGGGLKADVAAGDWRALVWFGPDRAALVDVPKREIGN